MKGARILLVEDDVNLRFVVQEHLELQGYRVTAYRDGEEAAHSIKQASFDLLLLDVMMPKKDGFSFAREFRGTDHLTPIIFLTAKSLKEDKIEGFKIGCDDYVTKPFSVEELLLRIHAVLKRSRRESVSEPVEECFTIGEYEFNPGSCLLQRKKEQQHLTEKEAELLSLLCLHANTVVERDTALEKVWGEVNYFTGRSMDVFISKLRKYFNGDESVEIRSVHGKGYKLIARVKHLHPR